MPGGAPNGTPPTDITEPLSVVLVPGSYGVVFGSGLFGAAGNGGLGFDNTTIGSPSSSNRYSLMNGNLKTLMGSEFLFWGRRCHWAMMLLGFAGLYFAFRQSRRKVSFN